MMIKRLKAMGSSEHTVERTIVKIKERICYTQEEGGLI
jgi:hypothetical protein